MFDRKIIFLSAYVLLFDILDVCHLWVGGRVSVPVTDCSAGDAGTTTAAAALAPHAAAVALAAAVTAAAVHAVTAEADLAATAVGAAAGHGTAGAADAPGLGEDGSQMTPTNGLIYLQSCDGSCNA